MSIPPLAKLGALVSFDAETGELTGLGEQIEGLIASADLRRGLNRVGMRLVDGRGTARVTEAMRDMVE